MEASSLNTLLSLILNLLNFYICFFYYLFENKDDFQSNLNKNLKFIILISHKFIFYNEFLVNIILHFYNLLLSCYQYYLCQIIHNLHFNYAQ